MLPRPYTHIHTYIQQVQALVNDSLDCKAVKVAS
jgi:hypothetical protein